MMASIDTPRAIQKIYDVSIPVENGMVVWPGDPDVSVTRTLDVCCGDVATVSQLRMGSHTGTHVDAFSHFLKEGAPLDRMPLEIYVGPALVVDLIPVMGDTTTVTPAHLESIDLENRLNQSPDPKGIRRVLFKTANSARTWNEQAFNPEFIHLSPETAQRLVDWGVHLVGVDYLSVEGFHTTGAPTHHILMRHQVYIVEGLQLQAISPDWYELICLPLKLRDGDGAPARVILRDLPREAT